MDVNFTIDKKNGVVVIGMEKNEKNRKIKMNLNRMWYGWMSSKNKKNKIRFIYNVMEINL